jgi:hypothetical protein
MTFLHALFLDSDRLFRARESPASRLVRQVRGNIVVVCRVVTEIVKNVDIRAFGEAPGMPLAPVSVNDDFHERASSSQSWIW